MNSTKALRESFLQIRTFCYCNNFLHNEFHSCVCYVHSLLIFFIPTEKELEIYGC